MKKNILLITLFFSSFSAISQSKWFFSFSTGYDSGGPLAKMKEIQKTASSFSYSGAGVSYTSIFKKSAG